VPSLLLVAEPGGRQIQAALQPLPDGLADGAVVIQAGRLSVLGGVQGASQLPVGHPVRLQRPGPVDPGPRAPDPGLQAGPGPVNRVIGRGATVSELAQAGQGRLGQPQPGDGLLMTVAAWLRDPSQPDQRFQGEPCTTNETTITAVVITRTRSRCGRGAPLAEVSGMDNAAASGTTPRVPAQDTTAGTPSAGSAL